MKKSLLLFLVLSMFFAFVACDNKSQEQVQLGSSEFYITLPEGYKEAEDDFSEDQVAYYYKDDESIDFDVYQWAKEDKYTLKEEANYFATQYDSIASEVEINGINGMKYVSNEIYDNNEYSVINYMFDDSESIVEISFWTVENTKELEYVESIISTIVRK